MARRAAVVSDALAKEDGAEALTELFVYVGLVLGEVVMGKLRDQTERRHGEPARRVFATAGERLLAEGAARGRTEQARKILERQLVKQFGPLDPALLACIDAPDLEQLEAWLDQQLAQRVPRKSSVADRVSVDCLCWARAR